MTVSIEFLIALKSAFSITICIKIQRSKLQISHLQYNSKEFLLLKHLCWFVHKIIIVQYFISFIFCCIEFTICGHLGLWNVQQWEVVVSCCWRSNVLWALCACSLDSLQLRLLQCESTAEPWSKLPVVSVLLSSH